MRIELKKFGTTLISRQAGSEAFKAFQSTLQNMKPDEDLEIDFSGVLTFSPSWGDEFLSPLLDKFKHKLILLASDNMSVQATLKLLQEIKKRSFVIRG
ncbi:hypothetical protein A3F08_03105 [Candidatus Berkelbacteria bacterium RIFCSPHIGHO2_12_FULL_36_9]|uniref:DUF4325 domain-containing protein n=1 Tax=Candidatus Berkelbacteria bacterium RIFCSPHIGHO2_12_FULL_36_9 TaxID=1797469 RepID=A0A1F5EGV1_9BACT|nr:MAG: hypothetical protein A3F08_03105 [Candidatus Berkelbacteria bacterium RIFCSPHIGHO2_12_FULL_36_9]